MPGNDTVPRWIDQSMHFHQEFHIGEGVEN